MTRDGAGVLGPLGVGADEERVYRELLAHPASTVADLRVRLALAENRLRRCLAELERKAVVTRRAGVPSRFQPVPPDIVVDALISAREDELSQVRLRSHELTTLLRQPAEQLRTADLVEVLTSREAAVERFGQLQRVTRERLEVMVRPPWGRFAVGEDEEATQRSLLDRGVVVTGIYDEDALCQPGILDHIRRMAARGEQVRVVNRLPVKLALFDRRVALVPVTQPEPPGGSTPVWWSTSPPCWTRWSHSSTRTGSGARRSRWTTRRRRGRRRSVRTRCSPCSPPASRTPPSHTGWRSPPARSAAGSPPWWNGSVPPPGSRPASPSAGSPSQGLGQVKSE